MFDPHDLKRLKREADLATCALTMASVHVGFPGRLERLSVYLMPYDWLDKCQQFVDAGADRVVVYFGLDSWTWHPAPTARLRRHGSKAVRA
jgi:hypothetical protein